MTTVPQVLSPGETVGTAARLLVKHKLLAMPVVDQDFRYLGMFLKSRLIALLLPRVVALEPKVHELSRMADIGFISDTLGDIHRRFESVAAEPVRKHLDEQTPILRPGTSLVNALMFLYRTRNFLPVVDEDSGKLVGVITTWNALDRIERGL